MHAIAGAMPSSAPSETIDQPSSGRLDNGVHVLPVRVYYEDTDFSGVVYHANYLKFMERGRSDLLRLLNEQAGAGTGVFAVTHMEIAFKAPARIHDALTVRTALTAIKGPRITFRQHVERSGELLCQATVVAAALGETGKARRPSAEELAIWGEILSS